MKLVFCHIPKTAGTSVRAQINRSLKYSVVGRRAAVCYANNTDIPPSKFPDHSLPEDWNFIVGHIGVSQILQNPSVDRSDNNILFISFVRDPVERLVSVYNFTASNPRHPQYESARQNDPVKYVMNLARWRPNLQTGYLKGLEQTAWQKMIGTLDSIQEICSYAVQHVTGHPPAEDSMERRNVSADRRGDDTPWLRREDIPADALQELYEMNQEDVALFKRVRQSEANGAVVV